MTTPLQAVTRTLERLAPEKQYDVFESEFEGYSLFAIREHVETQEEKDNARYLTARVNHPYPYEVIFLLDAD
jgi:hypothetical protein